MKKYLVITNNENYYLIEAISSMSAAKKFSKKNLKKFCRLKNSSYICK